MSVESHRTTTAMDNDTNIVIDLNPHYEITWQSFGNPAARLMARGADDDGFGRQSPLHRQIVEFGRDTMKTVTSVVLVAAISMLTKPAYADAWYCMMSTLLSNTYKWHTDHDYSKVFIGKPNFDTSTRMPTANDAMYATEFQNFEVQDYAKQGTQITPGPTVCRPFPIVKAAISARDAAYNGDVQTSITGNGTLKVGVDEWPSANDAQDDASAAESEKAARDAQAAKAAQDAQNRANEAAEKAASDARAAAAARAATDARAAEAKVFRDYRAQLDQLVHRAPATQGSPTMQGATQRPSSGAATDSLGQKLAAEQRAQAAAGGTRSAAIVGLPYSQPGVAHIFIQIDRTSINPTGGTNYVHVKNVGTAPARITVWTAECNNLEVARCGWIFQNIVAPPNSDQGFWINRENENLPWSYVTGCLVSPGATASCNQIGGGPPLSRAQPQPQPYNGVTYWQCRMGGGTNCGPPRTN